MRGTLLPGPVSLGVSELIERVSGSWPPELVVTPVSGGCINHAARVDFGGSNSLFLKWNAECAPDFFEREAEGLLDLALVSTLQVPTVLGVSREGNGGARWLALEYIAPGPPSADFGALLGEGVAALHSRPVADSFGWSRDNYIGTLPQANGLLADWADFWISRRLRPALHHAERYLLSSDIDDLRRLFERTTPVLVAGQDEGPALLHGDLWSGNVFSGTNGNPVLVDPALYWGHREVDLAMTELFGGFGADFYEAYGAAAPVTDGYSSRRRHVYQLYPLLIHVGLFGETYVSRFRSCLRAALAAS